MASCLLSDCLQLLPAAFPHTRERLAQFLIGDVQVPLSGLDVGGSEYQLDGSDVDALEAKRRQSPSSLRSCQRKFSWLTLSRLTLTPGLARVVSCPLATRRRDSQAVLKLYWNSPLAVPNT